MEWAINVACSSCGAAFEASRFHGPVIETNRTTIRAGIAALEGRTAEALCGIDMATLLDPSDPEVQTVAERSREILVRIGAKPFIERLDAAMARAATTRAALPQR